MNESKLPFTEKENGVPFNSVKYMKIIIKN